MDQAVSNSDSRRYLIIDLEATCWKGPQPAENEIIEIGAVVFESGKGELAHFQTFAQPKLKPMLSNYCMELTGIQQAEIDTATPFPEAFDRFRGWADLQGPAIFASWGAYDRKQILADCLLNGMQPWDRLDPHLNLKRAFSVLMECTLAPSLLQALQLSRIEQVGVSHRGLDDARNISLVLNHMIQRFGADRVCDVAR